MSVPPAVSRSPALRRERLAVGCRGDDLGVTTQDPEAFAARSVFGGLVKEHRRFPTQPREHVVGKAAFESIEIREIDFPEIGLAELHVCLRALGPGQYRRQAA